MLLVDNLLGSLDAIYFLTSSNQGNTWAVTNSSASLGQVLGDRYKILMDNSGNIYANNDSQQLYKSSDFGRTWSFLTRCSF